MPIVHTNSANRELKLFLKRNYITYEMLSKASGYSPGTIAQWFRHTLSDKQDDIIQQSIQRIMKTHKPPILDPSCCNYDIRSQLLDEGISVCELSRKIHKSPQSVKHWLSDRELSPQHREQVQRAMKQIREERRLLYEN